MSFARIAIIMVLSVGMALPALAEKPARPGSADARIRTVNYAARDVVRVNGHYGFTTAIEFADHETIQTVSIGDSEAWQVVKPDQPNFLFIKPLETNADTNLTVITDKRLYTFILYAKAAEHHNSPGLTFHVRFTYPEEETQVFLFERQQQLDREAAQQIERERLAQTIASTNTVSPDDWNFSYAYDGSESLRPTRVFDDGQFTYFSFPESVEVPAIFLVNENREESLINFQRKGKYIVVERLGKQFTLRAGDTATCIFNQDFPDEVYDSGSPVRLAKKTGPFAGFFSNQSEATATTNTVLTAREVDELVGGPDE